MKRLSELVLKMNKGICVVALGLMSFNAFAKAPITTDHLVEESSKKRYPAGLSIAPLESYMDMQCSDFFDSSNRDEFVQFFKRELTLLNPNFCSQVRDAAFEEDSIESEKEFIGAGTFSHLLEIHYNEFRYVKELNHYQDVGCSELVSSQGEFSKFFNEYIEQLNPNLCELVKPSAYEEEMDMAQADRQFIGMGTYSKIVEEAFNEFYFSKAQRQ